MLGCGHLHEQPHIVGSRQQKAKKNHLALSNQLQRQEKSTLVEQQL